MHKNFYGYEKGNVETRYEIEFIDDPATWKQFQNAQERSSTIEPWEVFKKKDFDNISEAITFYMLKYMHDSTYHIAMWEQVFYNGEMILENPIEPENTFAYRMRTIINSNLKKENERLSNERDVLIKELDLYKEFIKKYHAEESFRKWKEERQ